MVDERNGHNVRLARRGAPGRRRRMAMGPKP